MVEETGIERRVVRDQDRLADEIKPARSHVGKDRRTLDHLVGDAREGYHKSGYGDFRIDERRKLIDDAAPANSVSTKFDQTVWGCLGSGGFYVNNYEIQFLQNT